MDEMIEQKIELNFEFSYSKDLSIYENDKK